jgi:hypothetical protein
MTRHLLLALGLALVAAATALLLGDVGLFDGPAHWLFDRYKGESLWKGEPAAAWPWLPPLVAGTAALLVAWVAVDLTAWSAKLAVVAAMLGAVAFLSLTLAFYGVAFSPWPGLTAAALAFTMGSLLAETPSSRQRRTSQSLLGGRAGTETLRAWDGRDEAPPWREAGLRECAVLAVRVLSPTPAGEAVGSHLDQLGRSVGEIRRLIVPRPGVILDGPASDGVRAFFGFRPGSTGGDLEAAAQTALEVAMFLSEEANLQAQSGKPSLAWGVGLSIGPLMTGMHGPPLEQFWTASGHAAEQARQLAALNARHHTRILIGRRAADALAGRFELRPVEGDAIHTLLAARSAPTAEDLTTSSVDHDLLADTTSPPTPAPAPPPQPSQP